MLTANLSASIRQDRRFSQLIIESDLIIVGKVQTCDGSKYSENAFIHITEQLKGRIDSTQLSLHNVDEDFADSSFVIVFVLKNDIGVMDFRNYEYYEFGSHFQKVQMYSARILELLGIIQKQSDQKKSITEWAVKCSEDSLTRWVGIKEIAPTYYPVFYNNYPSSNPKYSSGFIVGEPAYRINLIQKDRLQKILYNFHKIGTLELKFIDTFLEERSIRLLSFLKEKIKSADYTSNTSGFKIIEKIFFITQDDKVKCILIEWRKLKDAANKIIKEDELLKKYERLL